MKWIRLPERGEKCRYEIENVDFGEEIGEGAIGRVYKGTYKNNAIAIKQFKKIDTVDGKYIIKESNFWKDLGSHKNIVQFVGCMISKRALVFELCEIYIAGSVLHNLKSVLNILGQIPLVISHLNHALHFWTIFLQDYFTFTRKE